MPICECPKCHSKLELEGCEETEVFSCPKCHMYLEVVSMNPPIVEESLEFEPDNDDD
jgi:lysine biosynthesis protein LysW